MTHIEYDGDRDRFYLTLYSESQQICGLDPIHLRELFVCCENALKERERYLNPKGYP
jgi:hypothetical protein